MKRGAFIVFEGLDRVGKTTQTQMLVENLTKAEMKAKLFRFPDRTTQTGKLISSYLSSGATLNDEAVHLLFSANRWESSDEIKQLLEQGTNVVCDRYAFSGVSFTAAKGKDFEWCRNPDKGLPEPDLVIFLTLPEGEAEKRGEFGAERYEKKDFQDKVREQFAKLEKETLNWTNIQANKSIEDLQQELFLLVKTKILDIQKENKRLGLLWS
eukprot:snap_masked-scaffold_1-processed-gene-21.32-mRNA-1 protein AED:0.31 eAED:0.31 QI:0/-1/0/1/-1/1/1/0/210